MSENRTKEGRCSSWLTEAASYGAEPVEPVPNRFIQLIKKILDLVKKFLNE